MLSARLSNQFSFPYLKNVSNKDIIVPLPSLSHLLCVSSWQELLAHCLLLVLNLIITYIFLFLIWYSSYLLICTAILDGAV